MWRNLALVVLGLRVLTIQGALAEDTPQLVLNAGGHTAPVWKVLFTPDGEQLVTVSEDNSVRFWDVSTGEAINVVRQPLGSATDAQLYTAALSQDGESLILGGFGPHDRNRGAFSLLKLRDGMSTQWIFEADKTPLLDLAISPDGNKWLAGWRSGKARLYKNGSIHELDAHHAAVAEVAFSPDGEQCATASHDGTAMIWSVATAERLATLKGHTAQLNSIDWSPDGRRLATGSVDHTVRLWTPDGRLLKTFNTLGELEITAVRFSPKGGRLLYTQGSETVASPVGVLTFYTPPVAGLIDVASGETVVRFTGHNGPILDGQFSPDGQIIATTGGVQHETFLWRAADGTQLQRLVCRGSRPFDVSWSQNGKTIGWKTDRKDITELTQWNSFDLDRLDSTQPGDDSPRSGRWTGLGFFATRKPGTLSLTLATPTTIDVKQGDDVIARLPTPDGDTGKQEEVLCFTLLSDKVAAVGHESGFTLYKVPTGEIRESIDVSRVTTLSPSPDGRYLLSVSNDMVMRIWNVEKVVQNIDKKYDPGANNILFKDAKFDPSEKTALLLTLFFADNDWIAWTPQGYYAASPAGERLMGWQVDSLNSEIISSVVNLNFAAPSFYPAAQFRDRFYRPDVIRQLLKVGDLNSVLDDGEAQENPLAITDTDVGMQGKLLTIADSLPPKVNILSPNEFRNTVDHQEITIRVQATQTGENPVTQLQLLVDGRPLNGKQGIIHFDKPQQSFTHRFHVPLVPGVEHVIQAKANNSASYALSKEIHVSYKPPTPVTNLPTLYVLAIGVADYDDATLKLDFADDDARRLAKTLKTRSNGLYRSVETNIIVDKEADRRGVLKGLSWLKKQMTQHDVGILFFSGHGAKDEIGNLYLLPSDVDISEPLSISAVPDAHVKSVLQSTPGRLVVMLDACHAGALGGDRRKNSTSLTDDLVRDLVTDDYGVVIMASSTGREFSLESPDNQSGMFTLAICEGLEGSADSNQDSHVYFNELDLYVTNRVKSLTNGDQHPVTAKPTTIRSFPLTTGVNR